MLKRFVIKNAADTLVSHEPTNTILFSTIAATNFRPRNLQLEAGDWKPKNYLSYAEQEPLESRKLDYRHHTTTPCRVQLYRTIKYFTSDLNNLIIEHHIVRRHVLGH